MLVVPVTDILSKTLHCKYASIALATQAQDSVTVMGGKGPGDSCRPAKILSVGISCPSKGKPVRRHVCAEPGIFRRREKRQIVKYVGNF
jgi:hypothetical protein